MFSKDLPHQNIEGYCALFEVENALRELIIDEFDQLGDKRWYKTRLSGDAQANYKEGIKYEKRVSWSELIPHHPVYYLDFSDLREAIIRKNNWIDCFEKIFHQKDLLSADLARLEPIRNAIAHNRKISSAYERRLCATRDMLVNSIGEDRFHSLARRCTAAPELAEEIKMLLQTAQDLPRL